MYFAKRMREFGGGRACQICQLGWDLGKSPSPILPSQDSQGRHLKKKKCTQLFLFLITTCPVITIITYLGHLFNYSVTNSHCDARTMRGPVNSKTTDLTQGGPQTQEQLRNKGKQVHSL